MSTNGVPILGQTPTPASAGDPVYYILTQWFNAQSGQGGPMVIDGYAPKLHGRPTPFTPAHTAHVQQMVKEALVQGGIIGVEVVIQFMWRYEVQPSTVVDLHSGTGA